VARLIALSPFGDALPFEEGGVAVTEVDPGPVTLVERLKAGTAPKDMPRPGEVRVVAGARWLWCGPGRALVLGEAPEGPGALVDQSDAWAVARLDGPGSRDVLARLTPLDLRPGVFGEGRTARTLLGHMTGQITPLGPDAYELMVFRSMAGTLVHDLRRAAGFVAGRARLG